jgi:hypothetical protein
MKYRILSPCGALGYGFPLSSFNEAIKTKIDLIAADAGSVDPGPYYLGKGVSYMEKPQLKRDFSLMLKAALHKECPLIIGSCGLAGDTPNLGFMVDVAKETFEELYIKDVKVAVISGHIENDLLIGHINDLRPLGNMPPLTVEAIANSAIVGQMGIAPFITALDEGAQVILAGRACDVAIFAADPIRRGIDPGLAFHAAHILECGAMAADPSSGMDCLIGEFQDNRSVIFIPLNKERKTTVQSIAAHSLFEESHPSLHFYPEGALFQLDENLAGIRKSEFVNRPLSIKLEGSQKVGERVISLLFCKHIDGIPEELIVYGRNGVEKSPMVENESEIGVLIKVSSDTQDAVDPVATILKSYFLHFDYEGRISTAGNFALPISPSQINFQDHQGGFVSLVIGGTRDPFFQEKFDTIKDAAISSAERDLSELTRKCEIEITVADRAKPLIFLETLGKTLNEARHRHQEQLRKLRQFIDESQPSIQNIDAGDAFRWSIYHLIENEELIEKELFPINLFTCNGGNWRLLKEIRPSYRPIGITKYNGDLNETRIGVIEKVEQSNGPADFKSLTDMATVIRSKNAGVNCITYEVYFNTDEDYRQALVSNAFEREEIARTLQIPLDLMIGSFRADSCKAIKVSASRAMPSGTPGDRDVFGAQQHVKLISMKVPIY